MFNEWYPDLVTAPAAIFTAIKMSATFLVTSRRFSGSRVSNVQCCAPVVLFLSLFKIIEFTSTFGNLLIIIMPRKRKLRPILGGG